MDSQSDETYEKIKKDLMKENNYLKKTMATMGKQINFLALEIDRRDKRVLELIDELLPKYYEDGADEFAGQLKFALKQEGVKDE